MSSRVLPFVHGIHMTLETCYIFDPSYRRGAAIKVFLSYRRADVGGYAGRLGDALVRHLGAKSVFQDVIAIGDGRVGFEVRCVSAGDITLVVDDENSISPPDTIALTTTSEPGVC